MPKGILRPNSEPQAFFLGLPDSIFESVCGGEAGGGKTESLLGYPIYRGWFQHPEFKGILFRETYPELEKSLIPRAEKMYVPLGAKWDGNAHCFDFKRIGGGKIWMSYISNLKDAKRHDTNEYNYVGWDEITHFAIKPYRHILHRIRTSTPELPAVCRAGATPGGIGNLWVYKRFVKPFKSGRRILAERDAKTGKLRKRIYVPIKLTDNIDMAESDPDYDSRIGLLPEAEQRAKRGDWLAFIGTVFSEFRIAPGMEIGDPPNALHVIPEFKIPSYWPRIIAIDWGFSNGYTCCLWGAVSPDGRLYIYREYLCKFTYITEWAREIRVRSGNEKIVAAVIDPSAAKRVGQPKTIMEQAQDALGIQLEKADNDRISGKMLLHELMRWKPTPVIKTPLAGYDELEDMRILRVYGAEAQHEYLLQFMPEEPETNLPKLQILDCCPNLVEAIQMCTYDEEGSNPEDVMEFVGDDPYDDVRYLAKLHERYVSVAKKELGYARKLDAIQKQFETTGDMGSFIRHMRRVESEMATPKSVRRDRGIYHRH